MIPAFTSGAMVITSASGVASTPPTVFLSLISNYSVLIPVNLPFQRPRKVKRRRAAYGSKPLR
jgi:hypothetical protein